MADKLLKIGELPHDMNDMPLDTANLPDANPGDGELFEPAQQAPALTFGRLAGRVYHTVASTPALLAKSRRISLQADGPGEYYTRPYVAPTPHHAMQIHQQMMDAANRGETWNPEKTRVDSAYEQMEPALRNAIDAETLRMIDEGHDEESARHQATIAAVETEHDEKVKALLAVEGAFRMPDEYDQSSGFLEDVAAGLGTTIASLPAFAVSPFLGALQVYETLRGAKVQELEQLSQFQPGGIDAKTIDRSATLSAGLQTPLESLANVFMLSRILKPRGTWGQTIVAIGESMLGEGATEFVQQYPDEFATILALNPDAPKGEIGRAFVANLPETTGEAAYAGLVGAFSGGVTTGAGIAAGGAADALGRLLTPTQKRVNDERARRAQAMMDKIISGTASADDIAELRTMAGLPEETGAEDVVAEVTRRITLQAPVVSPVRDQARQALGQRYAGTQYGAEYVDTAMVLMDQMARRWADGQIKQGIEAIPAQFYEQVARFETEQGTAGGPVLEQGGNLFQPDTTEFAPPRGAIRNLFSDGPKIIQLFQGADVTTPIHELSHLWTRLLFDEGGEDYFTLARWAGVDDARAAKGIDAWTVEELEKVARGGEAYIMEGRAPTPGLQPIFARLKEWFLEIYKSIKALGVELTPEVRNVFDRLVSLDFQRQDDALADVAEWIRADAVDEAKTLDPATSTWADIEAEAKRRVLSGAMDERKKADRDARKALMDEARRAVEDYPIYRMLAELRGVGLDIDAVKADIGNEKAALLAKRIPGMVKAGGMNPVMFAAAFGYIDVKSLAEDILATPTKQNAIDDHFQSLWDEYQRGYGEQHAEVYAAILGEEAAIVAELSGKAAAARGKTVKARIREVTGQISDPEYRQLVNDFKADARVARDAYRAGNKEAAAAAIEKQRERIKAIYQVRRDQKERQQIDRRMQEYISGRGRGRRVPYAYQGQIRQILSAFYRMPEQQPPEATLDQFLAAKAGAEPYMVSHIQGLVSTMPKQQFVTDKNGRAFRVPLTLDEKRHIAAIADAIASMGRIENAILEEGKTIDFETTVSHIVVAGYDSHKQQAPVPAGGPNQRRRETLKDRILKVPHGIAAELRKIEFLVSELDGWEDRGEAWMRIFRPIAKGEQLRDELAERVSKQLAKIFAGRDAKWARSSVTLSDGTELTGGRGQAFMIAANAGNAGNYAALTDERGNAFSDAQVMEIVSRVLTEEERQMVKDLWNLADSLYPFLNDVHRQLTGAPLPKVGGDPEAGSAVEQILAVMGETEQRYFPMAFDPKLSAKAGYFASEKAAKDLFVGPYGAASVESGHRVARKGGRLPLLLDLSAISHHFGTVIHDIAFQIPIRNAQKIFAHPAFRQMIGDVLSEQHYEVLTPWLQNIARPGLAITGGAFERLALKLKRNTSVVALGVNLVTTVLQGSAYTQTIAELGERDAFTGLASFLASPRHWVDFVRANSIMMRNRMKSWDRELSDMHNMFDADILGSKGDKIRDALFFFIGAFDTLTAAATWTAAYRQAMRKSPDLDHEAAIDYADRVVRQTQGTGSPKDLASVQHRSLMLRFVTMFYTFFSTFYNRLADTVKQRRLGKINTFQVARSMFWNWIVPASLPSMLGFMMASAFGEDDPEEKIAGEWIQDVLMYFTGSVPIIRDVASAAISDYQVTLSPVEGSLRAVRQLTQQFEKVARGEDTSGGKGLVKATVTATGYATGLIPAVQVNRAVDGIFDLMEGESDNPMRLFYRPYTSYK